MSGFRGRSSRGHGSRGRSSPRGGSRGRGGYSSDLRGRGGYRGRGDGFSRGRGGPPRHMSRDDDSPPRKVPIMSRGFDSDRGPPVKSRRVDRFEDDFDRIPHSRSRDLYSSPSRDISRLLDRLSPPRSSLRDRDLISGPRDFILSPCISLSGDSGSFRDSYTSGLREDRRDSIGRPRDFNSPRSNNDYIGERGGRDIRDSPRDYGSRDYPPSRSTDFREPLRRDLSPRDRSAQHDYDTDRDFSSRGGRGGHISRRGSSHIHSRDHDHSGDRDYGSNRFTRIDDRMSSRGPPRDFGGRGGRGGMRGGRDDRGSRGGFMDSDQETGDDACEPICMPHRFQPQSGLKLFRACTEILQKDNAVYLMIHHKRTTVFTDVREDTTVDEVKKILQEILKVDQQNMKLFKENVLMSLGDKPVSSYGLTPSTSVCFSLESLVLTCEE